MSPKDNGDGKLTFLSAWVEDLESRMKIQEEHFQKLNFESLSEIVNFMVDVNTSIARLKKTVEGMDERLAALERAHAQPEEG